jgi:predicted transcriptional regulator
MTRRARLVLAPAIVLFALAFLLSAASAPAAAFPTRTMYDHTLSAPGIGPIATGDLNGDGLTDLLSVDKGAGTYDLFLQTPGGMPATPTLTLPGPWASEAALVDVDGNSQPDIVTLGANSTRIFYQDNGTFLRTATIPTTGGTDLGVGDLNGDGLKDLAILTPGVVQLWFQDQIQGTWRASPSLNLSAQGYGDLALGDLRDDGHPDIVLAKPYELRVFHQALGSLDINGVRIPTDAIDPSASVTVDLARVDGDGLLDIVVASVDMTMGAGEISVYLQKETSFNLSATFIGPFTGPFAVGDLNDDGVPDFAAAMHDGVTATDSIAVHLQRLTGGFEGTPAFTLSVDGLGGPTGIAIGRFSGRPFLDLVARTQGALLVFEQEDLPPVMIRAIPSDASFNAGASGAGLIDLRNYFADDHGVLRFDVVYEENADHLHATLAADGHHLDFTAGGGWFGSGRFQVAATDGVSGHPRVLSNTFYVIVNALPRFTSQAPTQIHAGERLLYQVTIADPYPTEEAHTFFLLEAPAGMTIDPMTGLVEWTPSASDAGVHLVRLKVADSRGGAAEQAFAVEVLVGPAPPPTTAILALTTLGALSALGAAAIASENVKYALLMIFIPLYSKIKREQVLDHFVRGQIYGYVLANPGEHYNAIKVALNLTNGSLAHHLKTLEREQFVKSKRFGLYRRFYPMHMKIPEDGFFTPNEIQKTIVDLIRATPAITQKEIAERLGLTPPTVNYHVGILSEHGAIRVERGGRKTHCFVVDAATPSGPSTPSGGPATPGPSAPRPPT